MHEITYLWIDYFWSSLKSNGPEALVQTVVYTGIAFAIYPPFRKWLKHESNLMHQKLDHVIKWHPDIPEFKEK